MLYTMRSVNAVPITIMSRTSGTHEQVETRHTAAEIRPGHIKPQSSCQAFLMWRTRGGITRRESDAIVAATSL